MVTMQMHQGGHTQVPRRSRNAQARARECQYAAGAVRVACYSPQPAKASREEGDVPSGARLILRSSAPTGLESACVMCGSIWRNEVGRNGPKRVVGAGRGAEAEEEPRAL